MAAVVGVLWGGGMEQKGKMTHGQGQQHRDYWGESDIRRINNAKNTLKKEKEKEKSMVLETDRHIDQWSKMIESSCISHT